MKVRGMRPRVASRGSLSSKGLARGGGEGGRGDGEPGDESAAVRGAARGAARGCSHDDYLHGARSFRVQPLPGMWRR